MAYRLAIVLAHVNESYVSRLPQSVSKFCNPMFLSAIP